MLPFLREHERGIYFKRLTLLAPLKSALLDHNRLLAHRKMPFERLPAAVLFVANLAVVLLK